MSKIVLIDNTELIAEHVEMHFNDSTTNKHFKYEMELFRCKPLKSLQLALASSIKSKTQRLN